VYEKSLGMRHFQVLTYPQEAGVGASSAWKAYSVVRDGGVCARAVDNMKTASDASGRSARTVLRNLAGSLILLFCLGMMAGVALGPSPTAVQA
jgi:hypothetical protein